MNINFSPAERDMMCELLQSHRDRCCQRLDKFLNVNRSDLTARGMISFKIHTYELKNTLENIDILLAKILASKT